MLLLVHFIVFFIVHAFGKMEYICSQTCVWAFSLLFGVESYNTRILVVTLYGNHPADNVIVIQTSASYIVFALDDLAR